MHVNLFDGYTLYVYNTAREKKKQHELTATAHQKQYQLLSLEHFQFSFNKTYMRNSIEKNAIEFYRANIECFEALAFVVILLFCLDKKNAIANDFCNVRVGVWFGV